MPVTPRIITFLVGNPELNLHLPQSPSWEGVYKQIVKPSRLYSQIVIITSPKTNEYPLKIDGWLKDDDIFLLKWSQLFEGRFHSFIFRGWYIPSLKLTAKAPENRPLESRRFLLETTIFLGAIHLNQSQTLETKIFMIYSYHLWRICFRTCFSGTNLQPSVSIWVFPKIGVGPPNHPFVHRVFHEINHPFWGTPICWKHPYVFMPIPCKSREPSLLSPPIQLLPLSNHR